MPTAKRVCAGAEGASVDRLSELPDGLLHAVLSFLPAPESVRTSALSRRWRHLWRTAPCVNIDMGHFGITMSTAGADLERKWRRLENFATSLLLFRSGEASLDLFRLLASGHSLRDVDRWVRCGIMYCPKILEVIIPGSPVAAFPFPHLGESCHRLKKLRLVGVTLDRRFADQIRSGCRVLEVVCLGKCRHSFQEISSPTLKRLFIHTLPNCSGENLTITAPCLAYLKIVVSQGCYRNGISVRETDALAEALIHLISYNGETFPLNKQRSLLMDLCNVSNLELRGFQTKAMLVEESDQFPVFHNMQTLLLAECFLDECDLYDKLEALRSFLQNAPCLKNLTLQCCMFQVDHVRRLSIVRETINLQYHGRKTFQCPKLKSIKVMYEADHDNQLAELIWGIGRILPNVSITLTNFVKH